MNKTDILRAAAMLEGKGYDCIFRNGIDDRCYYVDENGFLCRETFNEPSGDELILRLKLEDVLACDWRVGSW